MAQGKKRDLATAQAGSGGGGASMIDDGDFAELRAQVEAYDTTRENIIKRTRDVQRLAKQAIYSLHRGDDGEAESKLQEAEKLARQLLPEIEKEPTLRLGGYASAIEEYAEGVIFRTYLQERRLLPSKELPLATREEYLGGLLDFTGELNRFAISKATSRDVRAVQECRDVVEGIMGQMLKFDLRNGALRKKFDGLKYTLKKMENTLYELSLLQGGAVRTEREADEPMDAGGPQGE